MAGVLQGEDGALRLVGEVAVGAPARLGLYGSVLVVALPAVGVHGCRVELVPALLRLHGDMVACRTLRGSGKGRLMAADEAGVHGCSVAVPAVPAGLVVGGGVVMAGDALESVGFGMGPVVEYHAAAEVLHQYPAGHVSRLLWPEIANDRHGKQGAEDEKCDSAHGRLLYRVIYGFTAVAYDVNHVKLENGNGLECTS